MCIHILKVADMETWVEIFSSLINFSHFLMFYGTEGREVDVEMILDSKYNVVSPRSVL